MFVLVSVEEEASSNGIGSQGFCETLGLLLGRSERDSEGPSVWKQLRSNLAANLLPFSHINLKRENGPRRAGD